MLRSSLAPKNVLAGRLWPLIGLLALLGACAAPAVGPEQRAERLESEGDSLYADGKFPEADAAYAELVQLRQGEADAGPLPLARALLGRARSAYGLRLIEVAAPSAQRALEIRRQALGPDHPDVADVLYWLALIEFYRTNADKSAEREERVGAMLRECERIQRRSLGDEHRLVLKTLLARAVYDPQAGRYDIGKSELLLRGVLEDQRRLLGPDHFDLVRTLLELSERLEWFLGEYHEAYDLAQQAIEIQRRHDPDHTDMAEALSVAAGICRRGLGRYAEARRYYEEAYEIRARLFGPEHVETLTIQANSAPVFAHEGDPEKTERLLVETLEAASRAERSGQNVLPLLANINLKRVWVAEQAGNFAHAERLQLAMMAREWVPRTSIGHLRNHELVGRAKAGQGDLAGALEYFNEAIRLFEVGRTVRGSGTGAATYATTPYEYRALVSLEKGEFADAWRDVEMARGRLLAESLVGEPHAPLGLHEVQASLSPSTAIVGWIDHELFVGGSRSWVYVIRDAGPVRWERLPRDPDGDLPALQRRYGEFRDALATTRRGAFDPTETEFDRDASRTLWRERFGPVDRHLEGVTDLVLIPSPAMAGLPAGALMDPREQLVLDRWNLTYAPSATIHARLVQKEKPGRRPRTGLLVGDPPFRELHLAAIDPSTLAASANRPTRATIRGALNGDRGALASLPRLPWTRTEVESIAPLFAEPLVLVGERASERALLDLAVEDQLSAFEVLHLATHGLMNETKPGRSALVLSQVPVPAGGADQSDDGLLLADEIARHWNLDASLVTLSSCDTGLGRRIFGEGTVGFTYPLMQAGARSVLASLWAVDDESGALLMNRFYENWLGPASSDRPRMTKAVALREAQLWLREWRDGEGQRPYAHPYFWSGFVLFGGG